MELDLMNITLEDMYDLNKNKGLEFIIEDGVIKEVLYN